MDPAITPLSVAIRRAMSWSYMPPVFGQLLQQLIDERDWSQRHFAELVGVSHTNVRRIIDGERTPDPADLERWAERLSLDGEKRAMFILSGRSARAKGKSDSSDYIKELEERITAMTKRLETAERTQRDVVATLGLASALLDQMLALVKQRGVEVPASVVKAAAQIGEKLGSLG